MHYYLRKTNLHGWEVGEMELCKHGTRGHRPIAQYESYEQAQAHYSDLVREAEQKQPAIRPRQTMWQANRHSRICS